jgi:hypothetical protein
MTLFKNPTSPTTGAANDAAGVTAAATDGVTSALFWAVTAKALTVVAAAATVLDAEDTATAAAALSAPVVVTEAAGVVEEAEGVTAAATTDECVLDPVAAGVDVGSGAAVVGAVLAAVGAAASLVAVLDVLDGDGAVLVDCVAVDVLELVCAPPLLLTMTPGATSEVAEVVPDVCVVSVFVVVLGDVEPVDVEPLLLGVAALLVLDAVVPEVLDEAVEAPDPLVDEPVPVVPDAPVLPEEAPVDDDADVSALANPGEVTTITPIPRAAASAPTRPT